MENPTFIINILNEINEIIAIAATPISPRYPSNMKLNIRMTNADENSDRLSEDPL
ncbi:MAG: hypothetical protein ACR2LL_00940 [Nitrosopumilus sp.]